MSELITDSGKKTANNTGMIDDDAGMIDESAGMININREGISEKIPKRRKRSRERGHDKKPRNYNSITLRNLKQYQNVLTEKNKNSNNWIWILVGIVIAIMLVLLIWKIYDWWKEKQ